MAQRRVEGLSSREKADERNFVFFGERKIFDGRRGSDEKAERKDLVGHEFVETGLSFRRIVTVVVGNKPQLAAMHAAFFVYERKVHFGARNGLRAESARRPFEGSTGADENFFVAHAGNCLSAQAWRTKQNENKRAEESQGGAEISELHMNSE